MLSLLNKITFIVTFVFITFMIQCTTSSPLENDKMAQLIERLDRMQNKMDAMQNKMDAMQTSMDADNDKWTRKFGDLEAENEKLKTQISHSKFSLLSTKGNDGKSSRVLSSPPTSCQELKNQNGLWPMDGIHLLKKQNKIMAAFCTFAADGSPVSEAIIGQMDIKTKTVHFYVQRNSNFGKPNSVIPFDLARLSEGGAFNLASGTFTVPVPGIYRFYLSALKERSVDNLWIYLQVNGTNVGMASTNQGSPSYDGTSMSASLRLGKGDTVNLFNLHNGALHDTENHHTHFSGWLVEEELM